VRPLRLIEAYESVFEVDQENVQASDSTAERWIDFTLTNPMVAPAFEDQVRQLGELSRQSAPGILSVRLRRSLGSDTKYLLLPIRCRPFGRARLVARARSGGIHAIAVVDAVSGRLAVRGDVRGGQALRRSGNRGGSGRGHSSPPVKLAAWATYGHPPLQTRSSDALVDDDTEWPIDVGVRLATNLTSRRCGPRS